MRFVNRVARVAEAANHHPDVAISYNKVRLTLTTHDEGGLTMKDFKLASKINKLAS
jgi:4a-hydroxytetrahydrobiopterin dehydratase